MATSSTDDLITRLGRQRAIGDDASILATFAAVSSDASASERRAPLLHALGAAMRAHQWDVALRSVDELLTTKLKAVSESDIESKLAEATAQIRERRYDATFLPETPVHAYAVAAFGKTARVRLVPLHRAS